MHTFRFSKYSRFPSCRERLQIRRYEAQARLHTREACPASKVKERTTRHDSSVLIFDGLQYEPFTESRRWANGSWKIARPRPPATGSQTPRSRQFRSHRTEPLPPAPAALS